MGESGGTNLSRRERYKYFSQLVARFWLNILSCMAVRNKNAGDVSVNRNQSELLLQSRLTFLSFVIV